jgi:flagellar M-ring protein FliF
VQNLLSIWSSLDMRRRLVLVGAAAAMFVAVLAIARIGGQPRLALLYAGLEPSAAGEVVAALEQAGVAFDVRGDSIHVDAAQREGAACNRRRGV